MMSVSMLGGAFAFAIIMHNLEEAILLPKWSRNAGRWYLVVAAGEFRFAAIVLTVAAYACVALSAAAVPLSDYLLCGYALAMLINVFIPHTFATLLLRRYVPGTLSALLLVLSATVLLLRAALVEHRIEPDRFLWVGPLVVVALLLSIRPLFTLGRALIATVERP
ncbi:MAG: HXXEE domain-containing protein [Rhizomicrobium sp.]